MISFKAPVSAGAFSLHTTLKTSFIKISLKPFSDTLPQLSATIDFSADLFYSKITYYIFFIVVFL